MRVARTAPHEGALNCTSDDPERQGWTEVVSYEISMTWPDAGDAEEPWVAVGSKPWNVLDVRRPVTVQERFRLRRDDLQAPI